MQRTQPGGGWSGPEYAGSAQHHRAVDEWFLDRCRPSPADVVVDLGCGSGEFSARVAALVPAGRVIGVDPDPSMLQAARRHRAANLDFVPASATDFDARLPAASIDVVMSRAMLHWLARSSYRRCFDAVHRVLRPGGWFHSESAAAGNVAPVVALLQRIADLHGLVGPEPFPDPGVVFDLVEAAGFEIPTEGIRAVAQRRAFGREQLIGMLRTQAGVALTRQVPRHERQTILDELAAAADELRRGDGSYDQTFVRLEILVRRAG